MAFMASALCLSAHPRVTGHDSKKESMLYSAPAAQPFAIEVTVLSATDVAPITAETKIAYIEHCLAIAPQTISKATGFAIEQRVGDAIINMNKIEKRTDLRSAVAHIDPGLVA